MTTGVGYRAAEPDRQMTQQRQNPKGASRGLPPTQRGQASTAIDRTRKKCFFCGRKGHLSTECRTGRVCYNCHKQGHTQKTCTQPRRAIQQVDAEYPDDEEQEEEEHRVLMLTMLMKAYETENTLSIGSILKIAVDSGSEVHVIPKYMVEVWSTTSRTVEAFS